MNIQPKFADTTAERIWLNYTERVDKVLRKLPRGKRNELSQEIKSHIFESFQQQPAGDESVRLLSALEKLGDPEEYLNPICAEHLLNEAARTFNPRTILLGLMFTTYTGFKKASLSFVLGTGYLILVCFGILSFSKLIYPDNIGLFIDAEKQHYLLGASSSPVGKEVLGYWFIPLAWLIVIILYMLLTRLLKYVFKKS